MLRLMCLLLVSSSALAAPTSRWEVGASITARHRLASEFDWVDPDKKGESIHATRVETTTYTERVLRQAQEGTWLEVVLQTVDAQMEMNGQRSAFKATAKSDLKALKAFERPNDMLVEQLALLGQPVHLLLDGVGRVTQVRLPDGGRELSARYEALTVARDVDPPMDPLKRLLTPGVWQQGRPISSSEPGQAWSSEESRPSMFKGKLRQVRRYTPGAQAGEYVISGEGSLSDSLMLAALVTMDRYVISGRARFDAKAARWSSMEERWEIRASVRAPRPPDAPEGTPLISSRKVSMGLEFSRVVTE